MISSTIEADVDYLDWAFRLDRNEMTSISRTIREHIITMREVLQVAEAYELDSFEKEYSSLFNLYVDNAYSKYKVLAASK